MNQNEPRNLDFGSISDKQMGIRNFSNIIKNEALLKETDAIRNKISILDMYIQKLKLNLQDKKNSKIKLILDLLRQLRDALVRKEKNLQTIQRNEGLIKETRRKKKDIELKSMEEFLVERDRLGRELKMLNEEVVELQAFKDQKVGGDERAKEQQKENLRWRIEDLKMEEIQIIESKGSEIKSDKEKLFAMMKSKIEEIKDSRP